MQTYQARDASYRRFETDHFDNLSYHDTNESQSETDWRSESDARDDRYRKSHTLFTRRDDVDSTFQAKGARTPIDKYHMYKLRPGDHIGWHRPYLIWHHAIVVSVHASSRELVVIHFTKCKGRAKVKKETIRFDKQWGECFRFDYTDGSQNSTNTVLKRAEQMIGTTGYKFFNNNCETMATYCKTGVKDCKQTRWAELQLKTSAFVSAYAGYGKALCREIGEEVVTQTYSSMGRRAGQVAVAEGIEHAGRASNLVGAGLVAVIEAGLCACDLYRLRQNRNRGNMTQRDYRVSSTQRVSEAAVGGVFSIAGALIGGAIGSCVPGAGTAVGSLFGSVVVGALGSIVGKAIGSVFGNWFGNKIW